ncbi:MAG: family 10 glycosylhydrolase [Planctomycetota bacterium]
MYPRTSLIALLAAGSVAAAQPTPEVRATWLTTTSSNALDANQIPTTMSRLKDAGLNTVYVEAWKNGYTNFRSPTLDNLLGSPGAGLNPFNGVGDILQRTSAAAREEQLVHVAWMEYGLAAQFGFPSNPLATHARDNGWLLTDKNGGFTNSSNSFTWMNPLVPEVRELLTGMAIDAVRIYGLDGIQFDDRLAWPVEFGYDGVTRDAYLAETGRNLPSNPRDAHFVSWRAEKITEFAQEMVADIRAAEPDVFVSASPSVFPFSVNNFAADWSEWADLELFDEYMPQVYRDNFGSFAFEWPKQLNAAGDDADITGAGLRIKGSGPDTPWADILQKLQRLDQDDAYGHSFWYSNGLLDPGGYLDLVADYYDVDTVGRALHPLTAPGRAADANRDDRVNLEDFGILRANFGRNDALVGFRDGDFNADGVVDLGDFGILRTEFGFGGQSTALLDAWLLTVIPEPASAGLVGIAGLALLLRNRS